MFFYLTYAQSKSGCEEENRGLLAAHNDENWFCRPIDTNTLINVFLDSHTFQMKVTLK
jgi:hypothetical protein